MAMRFMEGFDRYGAGADLALRCTSTAGTIGYGSSSGRWGGGALQSISGNNMFWGFPAMNGNTGRVHLAFWVKFSALPGGSSTFLQFLSQVDGTGTTAGLRFEVGSTGSIVFGLYGNAGATNWFGLNLLGDLGWHHIELEILVHTSGTCRIWFDGVLQTTLSGNMIALGSGYTQMDRVITRGVSSTMFIDDLVVWDETGSDFNTRQIGEHRVETTQPTSDSSISWTPNAGGTNYTQVDETAFHNSDTDYVQTTTIGNVDLYGNSAMATSPLAILCVGANMRWKKIDVGTTVAHVHIKNGSTDTESGDFTLTATYSHAAFYAGLDPSTSAAWASASAVNSALIGPEYQA